jgi:hypothetical protein
VYEDQNFKLYVDNRNRVYFAAMMSICKTTFICFLLISGAFMISKDATVLVLRPLEKILGKVKKMAEDPF